MDTSVLILPSNGNGIGRQSANATAGNLPPVFPPLHPLALYPNSPLAPFWRVNKQAPRLTALRRIHHHPVDVLSADELDTAGTTDSRSLRSFLNVRTAKDDGNAAYRVIVHGVRIVGDKPMQSRRVPPQTRNPPAQHACSVKIAAPRFLRGKIFDDSIEDGGNGHGADGPCYKGHVSCSAAPRAFGVGPASTPAAPRTSINNRPRWFVPSSCLTSNPQKASPQ